MEAEKHNQLLLHKYSIFLHLPSVYEISDQVKLG